LVRGARRRLLAEAEAGQARDQIERVWPTWVHITADERLVSQAEALAWEYYLRGYDAVHLASALTWQERLGHDVVLATFDRELRKAAEQAGLATWPE